MNPFTILVADDDDDDFMTINEAFEELRQSIKMIHVTDGQKVLTYLQKCIEMQHQLPDLILLDINMPRMDGIEALQRIKNSDEFKDIPILMYSTSSDMQQMRKCYSIGANGFVTKGSSFKIVLTFANNILNFLSGRQALPGSQPNLHKNSFIT
jgi:two-component system, response regulator